MTSNSALTILQSGFDCNRYLYGSAASDGAHLYFTFPAPHKYYLSDFVFIIQPDDGHVTDI